MLKLTSRQQAFLDKLFELYREFKGPVHYSVVAEKLGVNKFSAYDMLKVLEEKGVAASSYVLNSQQSGPGRSQVVFYPTNKAAQFITQLRDEVRSGGDWLRIRQRVVERLEKARQTSPGDVLREAIAGLPEIRNPLNYCAEMISILLLNLERNRNRKLQPILDSLANISGQVKLGALAGLNLAAAATDESGDDESLPEKIMTHTQRFQAYLSEMSEDSIAKLNRILDDAFTALQKQNTEHPQKSLG